MEPKILYCLIFVVFHGFHHVKTDITNRRSIPNYLLECYRNDTLMNRHLYPPMSMKILIELIRKIELEKGTSTNMALLANSLTHGMRLDGILRAPEVIESPMVTPYSARQFQFTKYQILTENLIPKNPIQDINSSLTLFEKCQLHSMLSSSVAKYERGDEKNTCSSTMILNQLEEVKSNERRISSCPVENGIVKSKWGTLSPGQVIGGIAAGLQTQTVRVNDIVKSIINSTNDKANNYVWNISMSEEINNVWAATYAGDLAEVVVNQGPRNKEGNLVIGLKGSWNDSSFPKINYFPENTTMNWEMTLAEIIGDIDGLLLGQQVANWNSRLGRFRLSQLLEMYYSNNGVSFDESFRACQRMDKNSINAKFLTEQVEHMAKLIMFNQITPHMDENYIEKLSSQAVEHLERVLSKLKYEFTCESNPTITDTEMIVIMDGTYPTSYSGLQFVTLLSELTDISHYGSSLGFINGNTGTWMAQPNNSILNLYRTLTDRNIAWSPSIHLSKSLETVSLYYEEKMKKECNETFVTYPAQTIVAFGLASTLVNIADIENTVSLIKTIKNRYPSTQFIYVVSNNNNESVELLKQAGNQYDVIIHSSVNDVEDVAKQIANSVQTNRRMLGPNCDVKSYEQELYVTPKQNTNFTISSEHIQGVNKLELKVTGFDYGDVKICLNSTRLRTCESVHNQETVILTADYQCVGCDDINFNFEVTKTQSICTEEDCRYPHQIRLLLQLETSSSLKNSVNHFIFIICLFAFLFQNK